MERLSPFADWQVGDLARCISEKSLCGICKVIGNSNPVLNSVLTVIEVDNWETGTGLDFAEYPAGDEFIWCDCCFEKIKPDKHEPCKAEFITLLKHLEHSNVPN